MMPQDTTRQGGCVGDPGFFKRRPRARPARELSMMIGAYFGARLLREGALRRRIAASAVIVCGVVGLALG